MKLLHLCEESQNYLTDPQKIDDYIKHVLKYKKAYKIDDQSYVTFNSNFMLRDNNIKKIDIKIKSAKVFELIDTGLTSLDDLPQKCTSLFVASNQSLRKDIIINTTLSQDARLYNNKTIESIKTNCTDLWVGEGPLSDRQTLIFNKIVSTNSKHMNYLNIANSSKLVSFKQLIISSNIINILRIEHCAIKTLRDFNFETHRCMLRLPNLENFQYVDKMLVENELEFVLDTDNINNILLLMLNTSQSINILTSSKTSGAINVEKTISKLQKYLKLSNRSDHIMDAAVELIDAGFEKAAEL